MTWLLFVLGGYFCNAVAVTVDTVVLRRSVPEPVRYATYVGLASIFAFVLAPWGFSVPPSIWVVLSVLAGLVFLGSIMFIFRLLQRFEPSRVVPIYGALVVVILLVIERYALVTQFTAADLLAAGLLVIGTFFLTHRRGKPTAVAGFALLVAVAGLASALYFFLAKLVFAELGFINGFIWTRLGAFAGAVTLWLALRRFWKRGRQPKETTVWLGAVVLGNRLIAGTGSLLVNAAVALASPALVNALRGVEFAFLFLIVLGLSVVAPRLLTEDLRAASILNKVAGLAAVGAGLAMLTTAAV
ncbi:hypothetical protein HYW67_03505 [Candidatus Parcubacteria bacterium]|nr:hypothetical protein [Candidatus Parcubacteria bacterium]